MGPEGAVNILYQRELRGGGRSGGAAREARRASSARSSRIRSSPRRADSSTRSSSRATTRAKLIAALASCDEQARPQSAEEARQHSALMTGAGHEVLDRQPRRDRRPRHPRLPRDGPAARSRSIPTATATRCTCGWPTRPSHIGAEPGARELPATSTASIDAAKRTGADARPSRLRVPRRERGLRAGVRRRRPDVRRPVAARDRADGQQDRGAAGRDCAPACPSCPAPRRRSSDDATDARDRRRRPSAIGYPADGQGRRRRRRQGHARRSRAAAICCAAVRTARSEAGSAFGDTAVYLERRLIAPRHIEIQLLGDHHGTVCRSSSASARSSGGTRRWSKNRPRPCSTPDTRRRMAECAARVAQGRRLHQRRHDRVPARRRRRSSTSSR